MSDAQHSPYRFVIVVVVALASFLGNFTIFQMAGLAPKIIGLASLTGSQFGLVVGISILTAAVLGLPLGALGDRVGVKPVVTAAMAVTIAGCVGRYLATPSFGAYLFWMFLVGATNAALNANFIKVLGVWLPPSGIGVGVGCYLTGIGLGQATSIGMGPSFELIGPAFMVSIVLAVVVAVVWLALIRNPPSLNRAQVQPMIASLSYVAKRKNVWIGGLGILFMLGTYVCLTSFAANFLGAEKGAAPKSASACASAVAAFMLVGALIADRLARLMRSSRMFLLACGLISGMGVFLAAKVSFGALTLVLLSLSGLASGAFCSFILSLPMLLRDIGPNYAGSAGGLISTLQSFGGFLLPTLIPWLAGNSLPTVMLLTAGGFVLMGLVTLPLPELVRKRG
ncbi:MAG: MFS transporter [Deltaproteobacteria bacterium]|jgi:NNP family nitrate/nitrite transporter-like MFS transporter|nr:MFS transporter [Deltaproteobacteria bacterium]